jgi:hypothetical protein
MSIERKRPGGPIDLDALLDPARAFAHPVDVIRDPDLTLIEKRAILAAWATRACAVEAVPTLLRPPRRTTVPYDDIMDALRTLDRRSPFRPRPHYRRVLAQRIPGVFGRDSDDHDQSLH